MYNAYKFKKDKANEEKEIARVKPLKEVDPEKAARKMQRMTNNANSRR